MQLTGGFDEAMELADRLLAEHPELAAQIDRSMLWAPLPGPQLQAWGTDADELFYGGAAGGGKTDFICGLALEQHWFSIIYRREAPQLAGITDRFMSLLGGRDDYSGASKTWRVNGRQIEYGSMPNLGDEQKFQGRPHDLIVFDEITQFTEYQYRYLQTWNRTAPGVDWRQRCRVVVTGNPPTTPEGLWVTKYWGPWLDPEHPLYGKVEPGELVYYVTSQGVDTIVEDGCPVLVDEGTARERWVVPRSRTFIPAQVEDNPFLMRTGYADTLEGLPEPLRSQMRDGDFQAGQEDHEWQVIPSEWVRAAQARWKLRERENHGPMSAMGVDCARGGKDRHIMVPRHGTWVAAPITVPGVAVPDGPAGAGLVVQHQRNGCRLVVDVIGIGSSVVDHLEGLNLDVVAFNGARGTKRTDKTGRLKLANWRSASYWNLRELLDPTNPDPIALPPGTEVMAELTAPRYRLTPSGIQVESKEDLMRPTRLGRSTDIGDAIVYAVWEMESLANQSQAMRRIPDDPYFDGPYMRETTRRARRQNAWCGFSDTIEYPD